MTFTLGAVAYDPKVVTIWGGFRAWFLERGFDFDYVLYSNYERQVEELLAGRIQAAWNSPLAWVRARRLAEAAGRQVSAVAMRDTDRDLTSVVVARADGPIQSVSDLQRQGCRRGRGRLAAGHTAAACLPAQPAASSRRSGASTSASDCMATTWAVSGKRRARWSRAASTRRA